MTKNRICNCFGIYIIVPFSYDEKKNTKYLNYFARFLLDVTISPYPFSNV